MIHTIDIIETRDCGPEARINDDSQEVFLNQGSLDGACGPYSIFMALLALGLVERTEVTSYYIDGRTRLGKLINNLNNDYFSLFKNGTYLEDLEKIIANSFGTVANLETVSGKGKKIIPFIIDHLKSNHPTIVGVNFSGGAHWMLAIGYEQKNEKITKLLLLDPSGAKPAVSSWNTIIDLEATKSGIYPYMWWTETHYIQFEEAIALW